MTYRQDGPPGTTAIVTFERKLVPDEMTNASDWLFHDPDYEAEDQARFDAWKRNEWSYIGVVAEATIKIPYGADWIITKIQSPGLWGVEDDSGEDYLNSSYEEEKATLLNMLQSLRDFEVQE